MSVTRVIVKDRFPEYGAYLQRGIDGALRKAGAIGVAAAHETPTRYNLEPILSQVRALPPERTSKGRAVLIVSPDWRSWFFLYGTYKRRRKKLSASTQRRRQSGTGQARLARAGANRGVTPVRYLQRARRVAGAALPELLRRELR